jgi:hypothetical protein
MMILIILPWVLLVGSLIAALSAVGAALDGSRRHAVAINPNVCATCGYALVGLTPKGGVLLCPECGAESHREGSERTERARWRWVWPGVIALLAAGPLTDRWWWSGFRTGLLDEAAPVIALLATGAGLCVLMQITARSERIRPGERTALALLLGATQMMNALAWVAWEMDVLASMG